MALPRSFRRIIAFSAVLAVTSLTLAAAVPAAEQQGVTIDISLSGDTIGVSNPRVEVERRQPVRWTGSVPFAIVVEEQKALFPNVPAQAMRGLANRPVRAMVGDTTPAGSYKYTVVVWDGQQLRIRDPEIVVKPD